jgi:osmotically inducible lipoprotein OsmB
MDQAAIADLKALLATEVAAALKATQVSKSPAVLAAEAALLQAQKVAQEELFLAEIEELAAPLEATRGLILKATIQQQLDWGKALAADPTTPIDLQKAASAYDFTDVARQQLAERKQLRERAVARATAAASRSTIAVPVPTTDAFVGVGIVGGAVIGGVAGGVVTGGNPLGIIGGAAAGAILGGCVGYAAETVVETVAVARPWRRIAQGY